MSRIWTAAALAVALAGCGGDDDSSGLVREQYEAFDQSFEDWLAPAVHRIQHDTSCWITEEPAVAWCGPAVMQGDTAGHASFFRSPLERDGARWRLEKPMFWERASPPTELRTRNGSSQRPPVVAVSPPVGFDSSD